MLEPCINNASFFFFFAFTVKMLAYLIYFGENSLGLVFTQFYFIGNFHSQSYTMFPSLFSKVQSSLPFTVMAT
jgi:hypothetical protein